MKDTQSDILNVDTGLEKWDAQEVSTQSDPIDDPGTGAKLVMRVFQFYFNPETVKKIREKKIPAPTRQELFNSHWPQLKAMLWGDGLIVNTDIEPRMKISKKKYTIILLCEPRTKASGIKEVLIDRHKSLNEYLKQKEI